MYWYVDIFSPGLRGCSEFVVIIVIQVLTLLINVFLWWIWNNIRNQMVLRAEHSEPVEQEDQESNVGLIEL